MNFPGHYIIQYLEEMKESILIPVSPQSLWNQVSVSTEDVPGGGCPNSPRTASEPTPGCLVLWECWMSSPRGKGCAQVQFLEFHSPQVLHVVCWESWISQHSLNHLCLVCNQLISKFRCLWHKCIVVLMLFAWKRGRA